MIQSLHIKTQHLLLIEGLKLHRYKGGIAMPSQELHDQEFLKERGVNLILFPFYDVAEQAVARMKEHK